MLSKPMQSEADLPTTPSPGDDSYISLKVGASPITVRFSTEASSPNSRAVPTYGDQVALVAHLVDKAMADAPGREASRIMDRSIVRINGDEVSLKKASSAANILGVSDDANMSAIVRNAYGKDAANTANLSESIEYMRSTWMDTLNHTGSMETLYLQANNTHHMQVMAAFDKDPRAMMIHMPDFPSVSDSIGHGMRTVVMGNETTSPQGFIQATHLAAMNYTDHAQLIAQRHPDSNSPESVALKELQFNEGKAMLQSLPAYETLKSQVDANQWESHMLSRGDVNSMQAINNQLMSSEVSDQEYRAIVTDALIKLGEKAIDLKHGRQAGRDDAPSMGG